MSLIPLDDQRGDDEQPPHGGPSDSGLLDRLGRRVRSMWTTVAEAVRPRDSQAGDRPTPTALPTVARDTTGSTDDGGSELQLVCTQTDDHLTVSVADNPDATITSDTWEPVER
jgi:hypothetical protein